MRRYPDLERQILLAVEADDGDLRGFADLSGVADHSAHQTSYQVMLLHEAGLLYAIDVTTLEAGYDWKPLRLTMAGHEYLETIRDPEI